MTYNSTQTKQQTRPRQSLRTRATGLRPGPTTRSRRGGRDAAQTANAANPRTRMPVSRGEGSRRKYPQVQTVSRMRCTRADSIHARRDARTAEIDTSVLPHADMHARPHGTLHQQHDKWPEMLRGVSPDSTVSKVRPKKARKSEVDHGSTRGDPMSRRESLLCLSRSPGAPPSGSPPCGGAARRWTAPLGPAQAQPAQAAPR